MVQILVFTLFDRLLWGIVICIMVIASLMYLTRAHKNENQNEKRMLYIFGLIFICLALNSIFLYICETSIKGTYIGYTFYAKMNETMIFGGQYTTNSTFTFFYRLALFSWFIGVFIFTFLFENIHQKFYPAEERKKPKYFLSIAVLVLIIISGFSYDFAHLVFVLSVYLLIGIMFWLSVISSKELQVVSILIIIGINLTYIAAQIRTVNHILQFNPILIPLLMLTGLIFIVSPFFLDIESILRKKPLFQWKLLIIINGILFSLTLLVVFTSELPNLLIFLLLSQNLLIYGGLIIFGIIEKHKKEQIETHVKDMMIKHEREELQYLFRGFTKPKQLSEEEISIAKESKICLVCKNKLARNIYICPDCNAFYCQKCSTTLASMENACWVCDSPFDESQPVKEKEQEHEEVLESEESEPLKVKKINEKKQ